jgi:HK97 family phage major capsid protein
MTLTPEQVKEVALKTAEAMEEKRTAAAAEANRKGIHGDAPVAAPTKEAMAKLMFDIRNMALPQEVRELAKITDNFALTKKWLAALAKQRAGDPTAMVEVQAQIRAMSEGTAGAGGYLVPEEFSTLVITKKSALAKMRKYATVIPMTTDKLHVPYDDANAAPTWEAENSTQTPSNATFAEIVLTPYKLKVMSVTSNELLADANVSIINYLANQFARIMAAEEDKQFFTGNGSSKPTGLRQLAVTSLTQASTSLAFSDILRLFMALPEQYRANGSFCTSPTGIQLLMGLVDDQNRPIFMPSWEAGKPPTLFGRPLIEVADWPTNLTVGSATNTTEIWFGDLSTYVIGDRQGIEMSMSTDRYFENDQTAIKAILRVDGEGTLLEAHRVLKSVK